MIICHVWSASGAIRSGIACKFHMIAVRIVQELFEYRSECESMWPLIVAKNQRRTAQMLQISVELDFSRVFPQFINASYALVCE